MAVKVIYQTPYSDGLRLSQARQLIRQIRKHRAGNPVRLSDLLLALISDTPQRIGKLATQLRAQKPLTEVVL